MKNKNPGVAAILPAYNAAGTIRDFFKKFPFKVFDLVILVDDASSDGTFEAAKKVIKEIRGIGVIRVYRNPKNLGYGGNMKRCLDLALKVEADIIVEIHPDGEYGFDGIEPAIEKIKKGADLVLGNRFHKPFSGIKSGMYIWKIPFTKGLTWIGNLVMGTNIPDMHQGFRIYSKSLFKKINYSFFSNDFLFTFEIIAAAVFYKYKISSVPVSSFYQGQKRGVKFLTSLDYSLKTFCILVLFLLAKFNLISNNTFLDNTLDKRNH